MNVTMYFSARTLKKAANRLHPFLNISGGDTRDGKDEEYNVLRILIKAGASVWSLEKGGDDTF